MEKTEKSKSKVVTFIVFYLVFVVAFIGILGYALGWFSRGLEFEKNEDNYPYYQAYYSVSVDKDTRKAKIKIPAEHKGLKVTKIEAYAFENCDFLKKLTIGKNISEIGNNAFKGCDNLTKIEVDKDNESFVVENNILYNKDKTKIYWMGTNTSDSVVISEGVENIEENFFPTNDTITTITIPSTATAISSNAFRNCSALSTINYGTVSTPPTSLSNSGVTLVISNTIQAIPNSLFKDKIPNLKKVIFENGSICTRIGEEAFYGCENLESIAIPTSVTTIDDYAFYASGLKNITFATNSTLTTIGDYAFWACYGLTSIQLPSTTQTIGFESFYYCSNLTTVSFGENSSLNRIDTGAFNSCLKLNNITLPSTLIYLGQSAFEDCEALTSINIPSGIQNIYQRTFYYCSNLQTVTFQNTLFLRTIYWEAFEGCSKLNNVTIPSSVNQIYYEVFKGCTKLTNLNFASPNGWKHAYDWTGYTFTSVDLTSPSQNAQYFKNSYSSHVWKKY